MNWLKKAKKNLLPASKMDVLKLRDQIFDNKMSGSYFKNPSENFEVQNQLVDIIDLIRPYSVKGVSKIRVGSSNDGGYVQLDDFSKIKNAISFGVGDNVDWDYDIANRGIKVYQFDHTVLNSPISHPNFIFQMKKVSPKTGVNNIVLDDLIEKLSPDDLIDTILKIDIEGDEWDVFDSVKIESLKKLASITCEFHGLTRLGDLQFRHKVNKVLTKINSEFFAYHVHANNTGPIANIVNVCLPEFLEVSFANRKLYGFSESLEVFPTPLDAPNLADRPDVLLGRFQYK